MPSMSWPRCKCASKMSAPSGKRSRRTPSYFSTSSHALPSASTGRSLDMVRRMPDVLMYADTYRTPELRHEVPIGVPDPFLYAEKDGVKHCVVWSAEQPRIASAGTYELHPPDEFGSDE